MLTGVALVALGLALLAVGIGIEVLVGLALAKTNCLLRVVVAVGGAV